MINSRFLDGMTIEEAKEEVAAAGWSMPHARQCAPSASAR
jgi:hypothetical protein